jgi:SP family sugar:H+ symporter-like MFS transporter
LYAPPAPPVREGNHLFVLLVSCVAAIGGFLFGFDSGVINGTVDALSKAFGTASAATGFAVASVLLGCAVGAFLAGNISDFLGRRPTMLLTAVIFLASAYLTGAATSADMFIAARVLGGLAIGGASVIAPMYISEVSPAALRGRLASLQQLAIVLGLFGAFLSNYVLAHLAVGHLASGDLWLGQPAWRWMFWMEAIPSAAFLLGALLIPESPRYLVAHGKHEFARAIFARIGGDPDNLVREVEQSLLGEHRPRLADLIEQKTGRIAPILWVGMGLAAFQQFVGINVIFYYGAVLWEAAGSSAQAALRINVITGFTNIIATFIAIALIDRLGRRPLLIIGSIGMALTLGLLTVVFATANLGPDGKPLLSHAMGLLGLGAANLYVIAFGISWGPVMWVLLGEMFPNRLRRPRRLRRHQLGRQLRRHCHLPPAPAPLRPRRCLRPLHHRRRHLPLLRPQGRPRNQGQNPRADVARLQFGREIPHFLPPANALPLRRECAHPPFSHRRMALFGDAQLRG